MFHPNGSRFFSALLFLYKTVANYIKKTELKLKTELRDKIGTEHWLIIEIEFYKKNAE